MSAPAVVSVNVGRIRVLEWRGRSYRTGFIKEPSAHAVVARPGGLETDVQADLEVHGGVDKAVYAYPLEHYAAWASELGVELRPGAFGENLTLAGLLEADVAVGDRLSVGQAILTVTQPRLPCVKMAARFARADMIRRFTAAERPGFYLRVDRAGAIGPGDAVARAGAEGAVSVLDVFRLQTGALDDARLRDLALASPHLGGGARADLMRRRSTAHAR